MKKVAVGDSTIRMCNGNYFDFNYPERAEYDIEVIAHALSMTCRYVGHTRKFYSVAEHSVLTSYIVRTELKIDALMHDSAEAFIGDVNSPLKRMLDDYKVVEERVERAIADKFGLRYPMPPEVKQADRDMLRVEQDQIFDCDDIWLEDTSPLPDVKIDMLEPEKAKKYFLDRYEYLMRVA